MPKFCCFIFNIPLVTFQTGLSLGVVIVVQSNFKAHPKGKTVLHADVGFLPGLAQLPGVYKITVEVCLQELCATQHEDNVICTFFKSTITYYATCFSCNYNELDSGKCLSKMIFSIFYTFRKLQQCQYIFRFLDFIFLNLNCDA